MFLQNSTDFITDDVLGCYRGCTCGLFVFRLQSQDLPYGLSDITVTVSVLFDGLLKFL
jgi:hypothetical protein